MFTSLFLPAILYLTSLDDTNLQGDGFMLFTLNRDSTEPLYMQIKRRLREMIENGTLPPGYCLPPERKLAESLGVNRTTILNAFRDLKAEGFLSSHVGQGTVVCRPTELEEPEESNPLPLSWRHLFSTNSGCYDSTTTRDLLAVSGRKNTISFAAGIAIPGLNPLEQMREIWEATLRQHGSGIFQHVPTEGLSSLRKSVCSLTAKRGITASEQETIILSGSQQGLDFLGRLFLNPGDTVVMEEPSFFCARQIFESYGARMIGIPIDENGMKTGFLENILKRQKPKFIYTIPTFHNPTGTVMSLQNRRELLNLSYRYHIPVIEDDAYGELRYEGTSLPPLKALDKHGYVIYLSTFSKVLFMGFRIGWLHAPMQVVQKLADIKQLSDLHTNSIGQYIIDAFIRNGYYDPYVERVRRENMKRRDRMHQAILEYAPQDITLQWKLPDGGLYFWLKLPDSIPMKRFYDEAVKNGVVFVPGSVFFSEEPSGNYIRMNFTYPDIGLISTGVEKLMHGLKTLFREHGERPCEANDLAPIL